MGMGWGKTAYQTGIQGTMGEGDSAILDVVEQIVRDLEYTLADNVLGGPAK